MAEAFSPHESYVDAAKGSQIDNSHKKKTPSCRLCKKLGTIHLKCGLHHLCQDCLQTKTEKEEIPKEMYVCRECTSATSNSQPYTPVFVDNSNLWIEAQKLAANRKNFQSKLDHRSRINYGRLRDVIANSRQIDATVYVSDENFKLNINGFKVKRLVKSKITGKEKEVDSTICKDILALTKVARGTAILISGDRDMRPAVEEILKNGWSVEIYMWERSIANGFNELKGNIKVIPLDMYWDKIVDIKTVLKKIPKNPDFSIVLTVKSEIFSKETRIDLQFPDWWNKLEQLCKWPARYKWLGKCEEARHLLLVLKDLGERDTSNLAKQINDEKSRLDYVERCETYANFLQREQRGPAKKVTEDLGWTEVVGRRRKPIHVTSAEPILSPMESNPVPKAVTPPNHSKKETAGSAAKSSTKQVYCCSGKNCEDGLKCDYSHNQDDTKYFQSREDGLENKYRKTRLCNNYPHCKRSTIKCDFAHEESDGWCSNCHSSGHFRKSCSNQPCKHPKHIYC